jgi:hypothetical protein
LVLLVKKDHQIIKKTFKKKIVIHPCPVQLPPIQKIIAPANDYAFQIPASLLQMNGSRNGMYASKSTFKYTIITSVTI